MYVWLVTYMYVIHIGMTACFCCSNKFGTGDWARKVSFRQKWGRVWPTRPARSLAAIIITHNTQFAIIGPVLNKSNK